MHFVRREFCFPEPLERALRGHFWAGRTPTARELGVLQRALGQLWPLLAKDRGQVAPPERTLGRRDPEWAQSSRDNYDVSGHYSGLGALTDAYAAYYLPANALKLSLVLEEAFLFGLPLTATGGEGLRWMDVGSGPGTAFWGLAWWAAQRGVDFGFLGLEQSNAFLKIAASLSSELLSEPLLRKHARSVRWERFKHGKPGSQSLLDLVRSLEPQVLSMMNSVGELMPDLAARGHSLEELVAELARASSKDGKPRWLVVVEPGSRAASRELLELREKLRALESVRVWLPCLDARPCGALARPEDWCHEEAAMVFPDWMNELGAGAGLRKEAMLFSYLVLSVGRHPEPPPRWPSSGARVVSQTMREKGLTQCFLCTQAGKRKARVLNSRVTERNEAFTRAVRGQVFDSVELGEKGDVGGFADFLVDDRRLLELDPIVFPPR